MKNPLYNAWHSLLHNRRQFCFAIFHRLSFLFPNDAFYLRIYYWLAMRKKLPLDNPETFNEKLQWLKLYNRKPEYTMMVDKVAVKDYVAQLIGHEYIIPTLGVWDNAREIEWDKLPDQFVLKTNHDSGNNGVVVVKNGATLKCDKKRQQQIIRRLNKSLRKNSYLEGREWPYKNVERKVFAEQYLEDSKGALTDYKFSCFDGTADNVMVCMDRHLGDTKFYFFDKQWNLLRLNKRGIEAPKNFTLPKPEGMNKMFELAEMLSKDLPYARLDFYNVDGHIYFGEITFFPAGGTDTNLLPETDLLFGNKIKLPKKTNADKK